MNDYITFLRKIPVEQTEAQLDNFGQGNLIRNAAMGLSAAAKEMGMDVS